MFKKKLTGPRFQDYEEYHEIVNTGVLFRAQLIEDWIDRDSSILDVSDRRWLSSLADLKDSGRTRVVGHQVF